MLDNVNWICLAPAVNYSLLLEALDFCLLANKAFLIKIFHFFFASSNFYVHSSCILASFYCDRRPRSPLPSYGLKTIQGIANKLEIRTKWGFEDHIVWAAKLYLCKAAVSQTWKKSLWLVTSTFSVKRRKGSPAWGCKVWQACYITTSPTRQDFKIDLTILQKLAEDPKRKFLTKNGYFSKSKKLQLFSRKQNG